MHVPVLLNEVIEYLDVKPGGKYIDATYGAGGHSKEIIRLGGNVLGLDRDRLAVQKASAEFKMQNSKCKIVEGDFADLKGIAEENKFTDVDGILFDQGLSSEQLDDPARGFSFQKDGPLDMRMNRGKSEARNSKFETAEEIVNQYPEKELVKIFYDFGEERRFGKRVVRGIMDARKFSPRSSSGGAGGSIATTAQLFDIIKRALPANLRFRAGDTARRIFQALRIAVNRELENLQKALPQAIELLGKSGRLVVISFHSLEDRIVKNFLQQEAKGCICPPSFPECVCGKKPQMKILTKKPVTATEDEVARNPRSKSAKLRAAEKIGVR